jgi:hypothetical protein
MTESMIAFPELCARGDAYLFIYRLAYKYSKIYSKNKISKATEDKACECYRRETRWRNATFTGIMTILSQDSAITKTTFMYLFGDRIYIQSRFSNN